MEPFRTIDALAVPIEEVNVDTNQLCPTRFNKVPYGPAYERILFHDRRFDADGREKPDFILNQEPYRSARILVGERNFGCGSSREGAAYALFTFGFRAVIAPSFGDIFTSNCLKNGLLPIRLAPDIVAQMRRELHERRGAHMTVDLAAETVTAPQGAVHSFEIHPLRKRS